MICYKLDIKSFLRLRMMKLGSNDISRIQRILDPLTVTILFEILIGQDFPSTITTFPISIVVFASIITILPQSGIYKSFRQRSLYFLARRVINGWLLVIAALITITFLSKTTANFSRIDTLYWFILSTGILLCNHIGLRKLIRYYRVKGANQRNILYWGDEESAQKFAKLLRDNPWMGISIKAWYSPTMPIRNQPNSNLPKCSGDLQLMRKRLIDKPNFDRIYFSLQNQSSIKEKQVLELFGDTSLPVIYTPEWSNNTMNFNVGSIGSQPTINIWGENQSIIDIQIKRFFDIIVSILILIFLSPLLILICLSIAITSKGPIIFYQNRSGINGKPFRIFKFRSMYIPIDSKSSTFKQATKLDPRVTSIGRILRGWSLDEIPQLINVIKGDMSLVGPRPHAVEQNEEYRKLIPGYTQRLAFTPGMTGLAQIEGFRGETSTLEDMSKRIEADLRYQRNWNLLLDFKILIRTIFKFKSKKAY